MGEYETKGGQFSEDTTHMKIIDLLGQLQKQVYIIGHYKKENNDELIGQGYIAVGQMLREIERTVRSLQTKRALTSMGWHRR